MIFRRVVVRMGRGHTWPAWIYGVMISLALTVGWRVRHGTDVAASLAENYMEPMTLPDVFIGMALAVTAAFLVVLVAEVAASLHGRAAPAPSNVVALPSRAGVAGLMHRILGFVGAAWIRITSRHPIRNVALLLMAAWSPYLAAYYPAAIPPDTFSSFYQGPGTWDAANPLGFTLIAKLFLAVGNLVGNPSIGVALYSLIQLVLLALILATIVDRMTRTGAPVPLLIGTALFFALAPAFPNFAVTMLKDIPFSMVVAVASLMLFAVAEGDGAPLERWGVVGRWALIAILLIFLRNNGILVVAGVLVGVLVTYPRRAIRFAVVTVVVLALSMAVLGPGYRAWGVGNERAVTETLGVPLQQVAHIVADDGRMSGADRQFLERMSPGYLWSERYAPMLVDPIKSAATVDRDFLDENLPEFLSVWRRLVAANPVMAVDAYALQTYGYWKIGDNHWYVFPYVAENTLGIVGRDLVAERTGVPLSGQLARLWAYDPRNGGMFPGEGLFAWIALGSVAVLAVRRKWRWALVAAPSLFVWGTIMMGAPIAWSLRYVFALAICAPLLIAVALRKSSSDGGKLS